MPKRDSVVKFYAAKAAKNYRLLHRRFAACSADMYERTNGVRFYANWHDMPNTYQSSEHKTATEIHVVNVPPFHSVSSGPNSLATLYSCSHNPLNHIQRGIPSELTELGIQSTLPWQLGSHTLRQSHGKSMRPLYPSSVIYTPNVQLHTENETVVRDIDVCIMTDVARSRSISLEQAIMLKLRTPFRLLNHMNQFRGEVTRYHTLSLGDLTRGLSPVKTNHTFVKCLKRVLAEYDGCVRNLYIYASNYSTRMYLRSALGNTHE